MADKVVGKKAYSKPEIRQIKLSLAELTLGTSCYLNSPNAANPGCETAAPTCSTT